MAKLFLTDNQASVYPLIPPIDATDAALHLPMMASATTSFCIEASQQN
jgi:hypothetical protein